MLVRLQKYMANAGVASRRESEKIILAKRVKVNGRTVSELGVKVDEYKDIVHVDGKRLGKKTEKIYYVLNKPRGYVSTAKDERGRKTVLDLLPKKERLYPVGRLDLNTSGLLLVTNDGELTYGLTHPKHEVSKKYVVKVKPIPKRESLDYLRKGGNIGEYDIKPCNINLRDMDREASTATYEVTISEGKNRQVRRMFEYFECEIVTLKRIAIGDLKLKGLRLGKFRKLTEEEVSYLKKVSEIE